MSMESSKIVKDNLFYVNKYFNFSPNFGLDIGKVWNYENSVEQYQAIGGTAKNNILNQIRQLEEWLRYSNYNFNDNNKNKDESLNSSKHFYTQTNNHNNTNNN